MPINLKHETFIREMIAHGDRQKAYQAAYPGCKNSSAYFNASRLLGNPYVAQRIHDAVMQAEYEAEQKLKAEYAERIASTIEKRIELATILRGQKQTVKTVLRYNKPYDCVSKPSVNEVLRAIAMDNELEDACKRKFAGSFLKIYQNISTNK